LGGLLSAAFTGQNPSNMQAGLINLGLTTAGKLASIPMAPVTIPTLGMVQMGKLAHRLGLQGQDTSGLLSDAELDALGIVSHGNQHGNVIAGLLSGHLATDMNMLSNTIRASDPDPDTSGPAGVSGVSGPAGGMGVPGGLGIGEGIEGGEGQGLGFGDVTGPAPTGETGPAPGTGDGGGAAGDGSHLCTWAARLLGIEKETAALRNSFVKEYARAYPETWQAEFKEYQQGARQIITAIMQLSPEDRRMYAQRIYDGVLDPFAPTIEAEEVPQVVQALADVAGRIAEELDIEVAPELLDLASRGAAPQDTAPAIADMPQDMAPAAAPAGEEQAVPLPETEPEDNDPLGIRPQGMMPRGRP